MQFTHSFCKLGKASILRPSVEIPLCSIHQYDLMWAVLVKVLCLPFSALQCVALNCSITVILHSIACLVLYFISVPVRVADVGGAQERRSTKGQGLLRKEGPPTYAILSRNLILSRFTHFLKGFHRALNKSHPAFNFQRKLYCFRRAFNESHPAVYCSAIQYCIVCNAVYSMQCKAIKCIENCTPYMLQCMLHVYFIMKSMQCIL